MSAVASAQNFATRNGITTQPTPGEVPQDVSDDSTSVESLTWHANGTPLYCLCTVRGGGTPGEVPQDVSDDSTSVESLTWHANGTPLYCLCTVRGGGHVIPQLTYRLPQLLGKTTSLLNAPREAVRFFERTGWSDHSSSS